MDNGSDFDEEWGNVSTAGPGVIASPGGFSVFLALLLLALVVVTLAGNAMTIWAFASNVLLRQKASNLLLLSLSCSDLIVGATGLPVAVLHTGLGYWPLGEVGCVLAAFFSVVGVSAGMYTVTAISLDRWLLVSREYPAYLRLQSARNVKITIGLAWGVAGLISGSEAVVWLAGGYTTVDYSKECLSPVRNDPRFLVVIFLLLFVIPFLVMLVSTLRFSVLLRRRLKKTKRPSFALRNGSADAKGPSPSLASASEIPSGMESTDITLATSSGQSAAPGTEAQGHGRPRKGPLASSWRQKSFFGLGDGKVHGGRRGLSRAKVRSRYVKPAVRLAILLGVFALCTLPYPVFLVLASKGSDCDDCILRQVRNHLSNLLLSNSAVNPFLYAIMHRRICEFYKRKLTAPCKASCK